MTKKKEESIPTLTHVSKDEIRESLKKDMDKIQNNIIRILKEKKSNQSELARAIESEQSHVNYILRKDKTGITIQVLGRIARALNLKTYELLK